MTLNFDLPEIKVLLSVLLVKLRRVELLMTLRLRATGCHLPCGITHNVTSAYCHPTQVNTPHLNPRQTGWYSIYIPQGGGWKAELTYISEWECKKTSAS